MSLPAAPRGGTAVREEIGETGPVLTGTSRIDPQAPVFQGHYPGFPILPGLLLVEYTHAMVSATRYGKGRRLAAVDRARFLKPVLPGDEITITVALSGDVEPGSAGDGDMRCTATVSHRFGKAAVIRLRYARLGEEGSS
ncbi:3-hydroxyacyl-ACP dehydratase FabZ family protein [Streptomyces sp. NPDC054841]